MSPTCDRCGDDAAATVTLTHVSIDKSPISSMRSRMVVCLPCRGEMADDPDIEW